METRIVRIVCTRIDQRFWRAVATGADVEGIEFNASSLDLALPVVRRRVKAVIGEEVEFEIEIDVDEGTTALVEAATRARAESGFAARRAESETAKAVKVLVREQGFVLRDAAELLGLSTTRVHQLLHLEEPR